MNVALSVAKAVRWSTAGRTLAQLFRWAVTLVVIRILTPEDYGLMALALTFLNMVEAVYEMGLAPAIIQAKSLDEDDIRRISGLIILISSGIYLAFLIAAPWLAALIGAPEITDILRVLALIFPIAGIAAVPFAVLRRNLDFKTVTMVNVTAELCGAVLTLALALLGAGVWSLVVGNLAFTALGAVLVIVACPYRRWPIFNFRGTGRFIDFGGIIVLQRAVSTLYRNADVFILGRASDAATVGVYSVAHEFGAMPLRKIAPIVNEIAFAGFAKIQDDRTLTASYLEKAFRFLALFGLPVFAGISSVAPELTAVILGPKWSAAALPLQLLTLILPLRLFADPLQEVLNGIGQARLALQNTMIIATSVIVALLIGVQYGILGMCLAWLISMPIAFIVTLVRSAPHTGLGVGRFLVMLGPSLLACCLMYGVVLGVGHLLPWATDNVLRLIIMIASGAMCFGAVMMILRPRDLFELWRFLKP